MKGKGSGGLSVFQRPAIQLFLCGTACLFWELVLIRWLGCTIRLVAYYTNFILISAFFGLGTGALLARYSFRTWRFILTALYLSILIGPVLGNFQHFNPSSPDEYTWGGAPAGVLPDPSLQGAWWTRRHLPYWLILASVYLMNTGVFLMFGQWLGSLFQRFRPLKAYTIEIGGSIVGILLFAAMSYVNSTPPMWFLVGLFLVFCIMELTPRERIRYGVLTAAVTISVIPFSDPFLWSRYYKIHISPFTTILDTQHQQLVHFDHPIGLHLTVNNDYHQSLLDLRPRTNEHPFIQSWRWTYDYPYHPDAAVPSGSVLIVGAGSGNDVSAALRNGETAIDAVEIDPLIVEVGTRHHPEHPYTDPRVHVVIDDARSFFIRTKQQYAKVVFGFLDSHTLMSSFSSLRLDNFVYTEEAMERVKELLLPGGKVVLTFAANTDWLHHRMIGLLDRVFDYPTRFVTESVYGYSNGVVYVNGKAPIADPSVGSKSLTRPPSRIPTDNWPFLYMKEAALPSHYKLFMALVTLMGIASLLLLPPGQRRVKFPYFFMGAGFFLIETSNVVSLSLLYGSTWIVNVAVFTGILVLILLGNLTCMRMAQPRYTLLFILVFTSVLVAYFTPTALLLGIGSRTLRGLLAIVIFLGPVYLASLIFGHLIKTEPQLYRAYGSNLLGAVIGGSCEYLSVITGLKSLLLLTLLFYLSAFFTFLAGRRQITTAALPS